MNEATQTLEQVDILLRVLDPQQRWRRVGKSRPELLVAVEVGDVARSSSPAEAAGDPSRRRRA